MTVKGIGNSKELTKLMSKVDAVYEQNNGTITLIGHGYVGDNIINAAINPKHTGMRLFSSSPNAVYAVYGSGKLDVSKWDKWSMKTFDNKTINHIITSPLFDATVKFIPANPQEMTNLNGISSMKQNGESFIITIAGEVELPPGKIENIECIQRHAIEYFGCNEQKESPSISIISILRCVLVGLIIGFIVILWYRCYSLKNSQTEVKTNSIEYKNE